MIRLGVNIDHVATVRQARRAVEPDPVAAAVLALLGGADGITVHLREDRRHIQDRDVRVLRQVVTTGSTWKWRPPTRSSPLLAKSSRTRRRLVPEKRQELTTEGGLDVVANETAVAQGHRAAAARHGIVVSLFIDPDLAADRRQPRRWGPRPIEIQTARYSEAKTPADVAREVECLKSCAATAIATRSRLGTSMPGTGSITRMCRRSSGIPGVEELNIGHSIVSRAVLVGMERAVAR